MITVTPRGETQFNWAGDDIVHDTRIPARRPIPGARRRRYDIDLRSYLAPPGDAMVAAALADALKGAQPALLRRIVARSPQSFDARVTLIRAWVGGHLRWRREEGQDTWRFPFETLALGWGDCEDLAFVLASLIEAVGVSPACVRVAFGELVEEDQEPRGHAWVMYQGESGRWQILEPLVHQGHRGCEEGERPTEERHVRYVPALVFNRMHVWRVHAGHPAPLASVQAWREARVALARIEPAFGLSVHNGLFAEACHDATVPELAAIYGASLAVDANLLAYDPRDHFDFSYIEEGWSRVQARMDQGTLGGFALAGHAVADFYAHSRWGDAAAPPGTEALRTVRLSDLSDAQRWQHPGALFIGQPEGSPHIGAEAQAHWRGRPLSGQWWRSYSTFPKDLRARADFEWHRSLPDHDNVAVDDAGPPGASHVLGVEEYGRQFGLRRAAALAHVRHLWGQHRAGTASIWPD